MKITRIFLLLGIVLLSYPQYALSMSIQEIMATNFGMREDVVSIYKEIEIATNGIKKDQFDAVDAWLQGLAKITKEDGFLTNETRQIQVGREFISVSMVAMYYANKYYLKDKSKFDECANKYMTYLTYGTHLLKATEPDLSSSMRDEIYNKIYMPLLTYLAQYTGGK